MASSKSQDLRGIQSGYLSREDYLTVPLAGVRAMARISVCTTDVILFFCYLTQSTNKTFGSILRVVKLINSVQPRDATNTSLEEPSLYRHYFKKENLYNCGIWGSNYCLQCILHAANRANVCICLSSFKSCAFISPSYGTAPNHVPTNSGLNKRRDGINWFHSARTKR
jgi:hypothetical protein